MKEVGRAVPDEDALCKAVSQSAITPVDDYVGAFEDPIHRDALLAASITTSRSPGRGAEVPRLLGSYKRGVSAGQLIK